MHAMCDMSTADKPQARRELHGGRDQLRSQLPYKIAQNARIPFEYDSLMSC